ncbi:MAG: hypothetical protein IPM25_07370 [Chloracidobacterium sp.]|nr:hypothetical protein [Chloracidobacterium sp.]
MKMFVVVIAILLGSVGLVFVFSDPAEGWRLRVITATAFFFLTGAAIGYVHPRGWPIALLTAWGAVLMGGFITLVAAAHYGRGAFAATEPPFITSGLIMIFGSLGSTLLGALLGKLFARRRDQIPPR